MHRDKGGVPSQCLVQGLAASHPSPRLHVGLCPDCGVVVVLDTPSEVHQLGPLRKVHERVSVPLIEFIYAIILQPLCWAGGVITMPSHKHGAHPRTNGVVLVAWLATAGELVVVPGVFDGDVMSNSCGGYLHSK